jgi:small subunit ribosomal protein S4
MPGITGEKSIDTFESRLDNVIYRAGFASTRPQARQLVSHRHFKINGKFVDVPSYKVKPGDTIEIKDASKDLIIIQHTIDTGQDNVVPSWLDVDSKKKAVKIAAAPTRNDASSQIEEQLIVELYSK